MPTPESIAAHNAAFAPVPDPSDAPYRGAATGATGAAGATGATGSRVKPFDEALRARLADYQSRHDLPDREVGKRLGVSATVVNKYLNSRPEGDVERLEAKIADLLRSAALRAHDTSELFPTRVTQELAATLNQVRRTRDVGVVVGPAGVGKTCGIRLYQEANPLTVSISLVRWARDESGIVRLMFAAIDSGSWNGRTPRAAYLAERLAESERLIVVDNAHRATAGALQWLFDFHDETRCPLALVGNPEIEPVLRRNDQQFSRVGIKRVLKLGDDADTARRIISQTIPGAEEDLADYGRRTIGSQGAARALRKQCRLAADLKQDGWDWRKAFRVAGSVLIRDCKLDGDASEKGGGK